LQKPKFQILFLEELAIDQFYFFLKKTILFSENILPQIIPSEKLQ